MTWMQSARRRKLVAAGALAAVGVALLVAIAIAARPDSGAAAASGGVACPGAGEPAADTTAKQLRKSVRCLINHERAARDLGEVVRSASLKEVAQDHSKVMAKTDCLAHKCPGEDKLETRLRDAGYFEGAETWRFAENTGCGVSAKAMVANWMATKFHRVNIVEPQFGELGVGAVQKRVKGRCDKHYATFAVVLGWRDAAPPSGAAG
jgi:uncharacterized protein YkwD